MKTYCKDGSYAATQCVETGKWDMFTSIGRKDVEFIKVIRKPVEKRILGNYLPVDSKWTYHTALVRYNGQLVRTFLEFLPDVKAQPKISILSVISKFLVG